MRSRTKKGQDASPTIALPLEASILLEASPKALFVLDLSGAVVARNSAALALSEALRMAPVDCADLFDGLSRIECPGHPLASTAVRRAVEALMRCPASFDPAHFRLPKGVRVSSLGESRRIVEVDPHLVAPEASDVVATEWRLMREMLEHMDQGVVLYDRDGNGEDVVRFFNAKAEHYLELPDGMLRPGLRRRDIIRHCDKRGDHSQTFDALSYAREAELGNEVQVLSRRPSGTWVLNRSFPREKESGSLTLYIDVTQNISYQRTLKANRAQYKALAEIAPTGIVKVDTAGRASFANAEAIQLFGRPVEGIDLLRQLALVDGNLGSRLAEPGRFEAELRAGDQVRHVIVAISEEIGEADGRERILTFTDITPLKEARSQIEHMARHDPLTGLGNRTLFNATWAEIEENAGGYIETGILIALDLDHFKIVNDEHGHCAGDRVLRAVAERILSVLPPNGMAFRLGGDEFAVVLRDTGRREAFEVAQKLVTSLSRPFLVGDATVTIGCSAGIASMPCDGTTPEQVQRAADIALYQVKRNGRNAVACFDPAQEREMTERRRLETDLARAVADGDFHLVFQPQIGLQSGNTTSMEALIRWRNKRLGKLIPPSVFIPIAESCGLITLIDLWVIRNAAAQMRMFKDAGVERPSLSINLSPISLAQIETVDRLVEALRANAIAPELLEIEITESVAIAEKDRVGRTLAAIQAAGMKVAIDDFGAGHTSLGYIQSLPIDRIKIDRSIIEGIGRDDSTQAIVASIHDLCGRLGLKLTAEGIETAEQWEELRGLGSIDGQGYYLGYPESADVLLDRLRSEGRLSAARARLRIAG